MKRFILTIIVLCSASFLYAQSPCEKAYQEAYHLYKSENYAEAKAKFNLVVENCDSNKEAAKLGVELCEAKLEISELEKTKEQLRKSEATLKFKNGELENNKKQWEKDKTELQNDLDKYHNLYTTSEGNYQAVLEEIEKLKSSKSPEEEVTDNQEPIADPTKICSENEELKAVLKDIYNKLNEYMETSGFKNWLNSKNLKGQADSIREKIKPYIATSDTIQDVKPTEKLSEQIK